MEAALPYLLPSLKPFATSPQFEEHVKLCAQVAVGRRSDADASAAAAASGTPAETMRALVALFLEAARSGVAADELQTALSAVLPEARARSIAVTAAEGQPSVRAALDALSSGPAELVDVKWHRATIAASGRDLPRAGGTPLYTITLTTRESDGSTHPLQFSASIEELTDLVRCVHATPHPDRRLLDSRILNSAHPLLLLRSQRAQVRHAAGRARELIDVAATSDRLRRRHEPRTCR